MPAPQTRRAADRDAGRIARWGIATGVVLGVVKIGAGLAFNSVATVSDGFESAADVVTSGLVLIALILAARPPDENHPYGIDNLTTAPGGVYSAGDNHMDGNPGGKVSGAGLFPDAPN